nr:methyl-accepting chemotaxis protein [Paraburkholderia sp. CNPSo 3274]
MYFLTSVKSRIVLVLSIGMLMTVLVGGARLHGIRKLSASLEDIYRSNVVPITLVAKVQSSMMGIRLALWRSQAQQTRDLVPNVREYRSKLASDWKSYYAGGGVTSASEQAIADKINALLPEYESAVEKELPLIEAGDFTAAGAIQAQIVLPIGNTLSDLLVSDFDNNSDQARDAASAGTALAGSLTILGLALIVVGAAILVVATIHLVRVITVPLNQTVQIANEIAQGRLDGRVVVHAQGEFGRLLEAMKSMSERVASTVHGIRDSGESVNVAAEQIADITGMIEGIAFQTNILALNAAVEAARAGEQGRGFAVVAGEVRALAQRASAAAREIKELIEASSAKVRRGAEQATAVNSSMSKVSQAIGRVSDIVGEISAASDEQSKGIAQVHQAITQIDEVTQQNAALVEQAAAAAQSLQEQAERMKTEMRFIRLAGDESTFPATNNQLAFPGRQRALPAPKPAAGKAAALPVRNSATGGEEDWQSF